MGDPSSADASVRGSVRAYLKFEGLAIAAIAIVLFEHTGASWWLFFSIWLLPDLSMLAYFRSPCWGARIYNAAHSYILPAALGLSTLLLHANHLLLPIALVWINHIGVDRSLGYGLKYSNGFRWTHLGRLGRQETNPTS
jgi:hypothetical protein